MEKVLVPILTLTGLVITQALSVLSKKSMSDEISKKVAEEVAKQMKERA